MNDYEAKSCHEAMLKFLRRNGEDKIKGIEAQAKEEYESSRSAYIKEQQEVITNDYKNRIAQDDIKLKIQRSANENAARIQKMKSVNTLVEKIYKDSKTKIVSRQGQDGVQYRELLKNLIVQGLIKLMEGEVHIRCRQADIKFVTEVYHQAGDEYKALMKREVQLFKDRDVPLKLVLETTKFLPEYEETEGAPSCMGGIMLHARKGRIVCANTLDERLGLVYQEAIPEIRATLFPSFAKKPKEASSDIKPKHH